MGLSVSQLVHSQSDPSSTSRDYAGSAPFAANPAEQLRHSRGSEPAGSRGSRAEFLTGLSPC